MRLLRRSSNGRAKGCRPIRGRGWFRPVGSRRSTAMRRRARFDASLAEIAERLDADAVRAADARLRRRRRRSPAADLHLLPSGAARRGASGSHAARSLRADDGRNRPRVSHVPLDDCPADRAGQGENPRCRNSVRSAVARRSAGTVGNGAAGGLSGVQRGLFGIIGRNR